MAFTSSIDRPAALPALREWLSRKAAARRAARARFSAYFRVYNELARLSDRDLADIGIGRDEIEGIAREHAWGPNPRA